MSSDGARVWQDKVTIPTYPVGPAEKNPIFYTGRMYQGARGPMYPYPLLDRLSDEKRDVEYTSVWLENEYLKLQVLPEIGGRIFTAVDKTNGYDFFYRQTVVKPVLIGMVGAWISGGVEYNVPHHHRPSTFMPCDWRIVEGRDGSKTVWLGETEWRHRMKWLVGLTIHPGHSLLELTAKVINRTPFAHSMLYFTNAAVHVNENYQIIFPPSTEWGTQHAKCEFIGWPVAHEVYNGIDYTSGVDVSWWKNNPSPVSIFIIDSEEDFFGGYDHGRDAGTVHYADHHLCPGKKFFTFANGPSGFAWDKILTDTDGPYLELMSGSYSDNQPDYSWIMPYETRTVTEYWYPVRGLGGVKNATREAALNMEIADGTAKVAMNSTGACDDAVAVVTAAGRVLLEQRIRIAPDAPFATQVQLPDGADPRDVEAKLVSKRGRILAAYRPAPPKGTPMPGPVVIPPAPGDIATNDELYLAGLRVEQFHNPALEPYPFYEEAIRRDPGDCRANTALGLLYLKRGMYRDAAERLLAAAERVRSNHTRPKDTEALYYLGVALRLLGERERARDCFGRAAWGIAWRAAANYQLAEMDLEDGRFADAFTHADESLAHGARNTRALVLKAAVWRRWNEALIRQNAKAASVSAHIASQALQIDPLDFWAANEVVLAGRAARDADAGFRTNELASLMRGSAESALELASNYENCGLYDEAAETVERGRTGRANPMLHYTLGFYREKLGDLARAQAQYRLGRAASPDYCFPYRLESIPALESAMRRDPSDPRAPYYLGNLLYDLQPERAVSLWEKSRELDGSFATVHRNLAFAYARAQADKSRAIAEADRAIECDPADAKLHFERDVILATAGTPHARRLELLIAHQETVATRDEPLIREILLFILVGDYSSAIDLLDRHHFHIWEGSENGVHDLYVTAHLARGRAAADRGDFASALADFDAAALYPDRFETGEPYDGGRAAEVEFSRANALAPLGRHSEAKTALERALAKNKKGTPLAYYQGLSLRALGRESEATGVFDGLVRLGTDTIAGTAPIPFFDKFGEGRNEVLRKSNGHYMLALGLLGKGDLEGARRELEAALAINMNHLAAHLALGRLGKGTA